MNDDVANTRKRLPERRHPPHFPIVERHNRSKIIFLTVCAKDRRKIFANETFHVLIRDAWEASPNWAVGTYVIMPDHIHLFCAPTTPYPSSLKDWVSEWKSHCTKKWTDRVFHTIWQRDFWDRQLRKAENYQQKSDYMRLNPVRKGYVSQPEEWSFQGTMAKLIWYD